MRLVEPGQIIAGRFEVVRVLEAGGQGQLYVAIQHPLGREVALKMLHSPRSDVDAVARFKREAGALARLSHPTIVQVFDHGIFHGAPYLVMEFIPGVALRNLMGSDPWPVDRVTHVGLQVARGLAHAHEAGVMHRDLSPNNIMIGAERGEGEGVAVTLIDFGLAKVLREESMTSQTGSVLGTPSYVAPERIRGESGSTMADVYSCGIVLYELLTGVHPFRRDTPLATLAAALHEPVPPLADVMDITEVPSTLVMLIEAATQHKAADRPADGNELRKLLAMATREIEGQKAVAVPRLTAGVANLPADFDDPPSVTDLPALSESPPAQPNANLIDPIAPAHRSPTLDAPPLARPPPKRPANPPAPPASASGLTILWVLLGAIAAAATVAVGLVLTRAFM